VKADYRTVDHQFGWADRRHVPNLWSGVLIALQCQCVPYRRHVLSCHVARGGFRTGTATLKRGILQTLLDRFCGLVVRVPGYTSRGPGSIPGAARFSEK
jgi:hypothetical protein